MVRVARSVYLIKGCACDDEGNRVEIDWKVVELRGGLRWEARRPLWCLHEKAYRVLFEPARWLRRRRADLEKDLDRFAVGYDEAIITSRLAVSSRERRLDAGEQLPHREDARQEFTMTTLALLVTLIWCAVHKHENSAKARAVAAMLALFQSCLGAESLNIRQLFSPAQLSRRCRSAPLGMVRCMRQDIFESAAMAIVGANPQATLTRLIVLVYKHASQCPSLDETFVLVVFEIARRIEAHIGKSEPTRVEALASFRVAGRKRTRVDEDYMDTKTNDLVSTGAVMSGGVALRHDDLHDESLARMWEKKTMLSYLREARRVFANARVFSIASDAGRVGDPPEETRFFLGFSGCVEYGVILPPQAGAFSVHLFPPITRPPVHHFLLWLSLARPSFVAPSLSTQTILSR